MRDMLRKLAVGSLGRTAMLASAGLWARALIQAGYLVALSRWIGPEGYGLFSGSVAMAVVVAPLAGWGTSFVYSQTVSRDRSAAPGMWAGVLSMTATTGLLLVAIMVPASLLLTDVRLGAAAMLALAVAELVALPANIAATRVLMTSGRGGAVALSSCLVPMARLISVVILLVANAGNASVTEVAMAHLGGSLVGAIAAVALVSRLEVSPDWSRRPSLLNLGAKGTGYAVGAVSGLSYREVDKVLVLQLLGPMATGVYTAAFRIVGMFILPIIGLVGAAMPKLFAADGVGERARLLRSLLMFASAYALLAVLACMAIAPFVPYVLGGGYEKATSAMVWLAPWILLFTVHQVAALGLTCTGRQAERVTVDVAGLVLVVALNMLLLDRWGIQAAIFALFVAEALMAACCWLLLSRRRLRAAC